MRLVDGEGAAQQRLEGSVRFEHRKLAGARFDLLIEAQREQAIARRQLAVRFDSGDRINHA